MAHRPHVPFVLFKQDSLLFLLVGAILASVTTLPILPQHPFSVIIMWWIPNLPKPVMNAMCLLDHGLVSFFSSKLCVGGVVAALKPHAFSSLERTSFTLAIS